MMTKNQDQWVMGIMSDESINGIDVAFLKTDGEFIFEYGPTLFVPYTKMQRDEIRRSIGYLQRNKQVIALEHNLTVWHARVARKALDQFKISLDNLSFIGCHGHTLAHVPQAKKTLQIFDGEAFASYLGIPVVYDFYTSDIMHGGEGGALWATFHSALGHKWKKPFLFLTLGQNTNITLVTKSGLYACDVGPGVDLINDIINCNDNQKIKKIEQWISRGKILIDKVDYFFQNPFFSRKIPKFLDCNALHLSFNTICPIEDRLTTVIYIIALSIYKILYYLPTNPLFCVVKNDDANNKFLMYLLKTLLPFSVYSFEEYNSSAFMGYALGFLAVRVARGLPITFPTTTGCSHPIVGGKISYPVISKENIPITGV